MNQPEVNGLLCVGLHQTDGGDELYATECLKMNQGSSHETNKLDAVMSASTMHSDHNNANACVDDYQHTKMMAGIQPMEEVGFGCTQPFELQSQVCIFNANVFIQLVIPFLLLQYCYYLSGDSTWFWGRKLAI